MSCPCGEVQPLGGTRQQIAGRLIYEKAPVHVCQETIYRFVYALEGMKENLWWYLPEHRRKRRPCKGRVPKKPEIHPDLGIANCPEIIGDRVQFGNWESDLMLFTAFDDIPQTSRITLYTEVWKGQRDIAC